MMQRDLYIMNDVDPGLSGATLVRTNEEASAWNKLGYGVYWAVNEFSGVSRERRIANLGSILSWAVELDKGEKWHQLGLIESSPIWPSLIVESKRGFQIYFDALSPTVNNFGEILDRLVYFFDADSKAKDLTRLLRAPGYFHMKDPNDPFLVRKIWERDAQYTEAIMLYAFPPMPEQKIEPVVEYKPSTTKYLQRENPTADSFWERLYNLNCEEGLMRLSGKPCVNSEVYTFRPVSNGNLNILANGKATSCFIDKHKRIGSLDKGGPTLWQWLKWFGHPSSYIFETLRKEFPELC